MKVIVRLKVNPDVPITFEDCHPAFDPDSKEIVISGMDCDVQAVYDLDFIDSIAWILR